MAAFSGTRTLTQDGFIIHLFASSGVFMPQFTGNVEALVVAGGGGGGMDMGGGGGGGGVLSSTTYAVTAGTPITVTVGAGGTGAPGGGSNGQPGGHQFTIAATNGSNSVFGSLTATGGGKGGSSYFAYTPDNGTGGNGGSGGGASGYSDGNTGRAGTGTAGQGNNGGGCVGAYYAGGGGGAGAAGGSGTGSGAAVGGAGILNSILGVDYYWGGGGGGASYSTIGGAGGIGGGGSSGTTNTAGGEGFSPGGPGGNGLTGAWGNRPGGNGGINTGGGGGGGSHYNSNNRGGNGGSGIVIIRYPASLSKTSTGGNILNTSGLILHYDMGNTDKSWKGKPTTNLVSNATAFSGWTNYYRTLERTSFTTEFGTTGWRFINQPSWSGIYLVYSVPSTGTYTFSAYYKYLGGSTNNNGGTVYVAGWGGGDSAVGVNKNLVGVWQRVQMTLNLTNLGGVFYLISYGGTDNGTTSPDNTSFEVTMPMIEAGSFATPFVEGTRSETQALLDMTKNNTITVNNLTYNSDGTFSFNGSNSDIRAPLFSNARTNVTMNGWFYVNLGTIGTFLSNGDDPGGYCLGIGEYFSASDNQICALFGYVRWILTGAFYQYTGWHMITFVLDNDGNPSIYINGNLIGYYPGAIANVPTAGSGFSVGSQWGIRYANTRSSHVSFYNRALTAAEIKQNFNALRGRFGI